MPIILDRTLVTDIGDQFNVGSERDLFGLEVELEGVNVLTTRDSIIKYWAIHNDGSLRINKLGAQACEYVFKKPLGLKDTQEALKLLFKYLNDTPGVEVFDSYRTSIHVHVNCLSETIRTIVNFITLAIIFDELFVSQNGETRIGNNFCLRSRDAEGQITGLCKSVRDYGSLYQIHANDRYSSVNISSLLKFGTIEFRSMECTTDLKRMIHWINTIQALKVSARQYEDPREIIRNFSRRGPLGFMIAHLGDQYGKYAAVPGAHHMLHNGMRLAQDFAFCSDWVQPKPGEMVKVVPKPKPKKVQINIEGINPAPPPEANLYHNMLAQIHAQAQQANHANIIWDVGAYDPFAQQPPVAPGWVHHALPADPQPEIEIDWHDDDHDAFLDDLDDGEIEHDEI